MSAALNQASYGARLLKRPLTVLALLWLLCLVLGALLAPLLAPLDPLDQDLLAIKQLPSAEHWLGTDALGRDIWSRVLFGLAPTVKGVMEAVLIASGLGLSLGMTAGYYGGVWDRWVQQYVGLLQSMPNILIMLAVLAVFGQTMLPAMVTLGVLGSAGVSRVIRSVTLGVREDLYIAAAQICGMSDFYIITRHILPRIVGPVIVQMAMFAAISVIVQTGISFLGLGEPPPAPTWGGMIAEASASLNDFPWLLVPSGFVVALTILSFGILGDSLRDASTEKWSKPSQKSIVTQRTSSKPADLPSGHLLSIRDLNIQAVNGAQSHALVSHLKLDLQPGETLGIVGESGSGKTLTSLSLLGLLPAGTQVVSGTVAIDDQVFDLTDVKSLAQMRGHTIGMIFQEPMSALDPCFTIGYQLAEVIQLNSNLQAQQVQQKVIELLEQVKIPHPLEVAARYPHQISGGMAQRVGIARALACEPKILLADEPTTALDVTVQAEILALLRGLSQSRNMAVILVTHDWGVVADLCDRAMVLRHGKVLEAASVLDLFQRPTHPYTKALLAANPHSAEPGKLLPTVDDKLMDMQGAAS